MSPPGPGTTPQADLRAPQVQHAPPTPGEQREQRERPAPGEQRERPAPGEQRQQHEPDVLPQVHALLARLGEVDVHALGAHGRAGRLGRLRRCVDALEVEFTRTLAAADAHGDGELLDGARSTTSWLRSTLRLAPGDAAERVRIARAAFTGTAPLAAAAAAVQASAASVGEGVVGTAGADPQRADQDGAGVDGADAHGADAHGAAVAGADVAGADEASTDRARGAGSGPVSYEQLRAIERGTRDLAPEPAKRAAGLLTELAREVDTAAVRLAARHLRHVVDPDGARRDAESLFEARRASFAPLLDGMYRLELLADPEGAALLDAAIRSLTAPADGDDTRTIAQRRYDAIIEVFRRALTTSDLPAVNGQPPHLLVTCTPQTLTGHPDAAPAVLPDGTPVPADTLARIACDSVLERIVFGPRGEILDYGRARRLFTPAQRKALWARDRGCRFPGCGAPWTQAHHLIPWTAGGPTDLTNALLLCPFHHHRLHEGRWRADAVDPTLDTNGPIDFTDPTGHHRRSHPPSRCWPITTSLSAGENGDQNAESRLTSADSVKYRVQSGQSAEPRDEHSAPTTAAVRVTSDASVELTAPVVAQVAAPVLVQPVARPP